MPKAESSPPPASAAAGGSGAAIPSELLDAATRPSGATAPIEAIFTTVRKLCIPAPGFRPKWLTTVMKRIATMPATCAPLSAQVQEPIVAEASTCDEEHQGMKAARYSPKPMAIAAAPPDM